MLWVALTATALIQFGSHYLPWGRVIGKRELPRLFAYGIGVGGMLIPLTIWMAAGGSIDLLILWGFALNAGIGTLLAYLLDCVLEMRDQAREAHQREGLLMDQRDAQDE